MNPDRIKELEAKVKKMNELEHREFVRRSQKSWMLKTLKFLFEKSYNFIQKRI